MTWSVFWLVLGWHLLTLAAIRFDYLRWIMLTLDSLNDPCCLATIFVNSTTETNMILMFRWHKGNKPSQQGVDINPRLTKIVIGFTTYEVKENNTSLWLLVLQQNADIHTCYTTTKRSNWHSCLNCVCFSYTINTCHPVPLPPVTYMA